MLVRVDNIFVIFAVYHKKSTFLYDFILNIHTNNHFKMQVHSNINQTIGLFY